MAGAEERDENPYVGPRPFERAERLNFFGRDGELQEVLSLVIANRVVLLYAASGAGKTSLLSAALIPALEQTDFSVMPIARVRGLLEEGAPIGKGRNIYALGVVSNWADGPTAPVDGQDPVSEDRDGSLSDFLRKRRDALAEEARPTPLAVVIDQFEELFTLHPERWQERKAFIEELTRALEQDPLLRVVLSIREDYLAHLDPYASLLPGALRGRFRLERLSRNPALRAVAGPLEHTTRSFAPGVAESLVDNLLRVRVDTGRGRIVELDGEFVEPVQLQVACSSLWSRLPPDVIEITEEHRLTFGDVDRVLSEFYDEAIAAAAARAREKEDRLRARLEQTLITPMGTRGTMFQSEGKAAAIPAAAVAELEDRHLIRAELRAGARWYELTHDRLIEPIRASNRRRFEIARTRRYRLLVAVVATLALLFAALLLSYFQFLRGQDAPSIAEQQAVWVLTSPLTVSGGGTEAFNTSWDTHGAAFSDDSRRVLTLDGRRGLVWDAVTGKQLAVLRGHTGPITSATFSGPDDRVVVTGSNDRTARVWETDTGRQLVVLRARSPMATIASSPDARYVFTLGDEGEARIWSTDDEKAVAVLRVPPGVPGELTASFSPDGKLIVASLGDFDARVWNVPSGQRALELSHENITYSGTFSPDGTRVLTISYDLARIWDARTGSLVADLRGHDSSISDSAFSGNGKRVVTASLDGTARVWDASSGREIAVLRGHEYGADTAAFSPEGKYVVTAGGDGIAVWEAATGALRAVLDPGQGYYSAAFSPDGRFLMGVLTGQTNLWRVGRIELLRGGSPRG